ncbi:transposase [Streptomyces sp. NPDC057611]|uniref:transposase n=1 Tax=Streptomyces sp. NPDC057611 TaxID=3346182 RepID=UPI0036A55F3D
MIEAFKDKPGTLTRPDARRILAVAPTPALAAKLQMWKLTAMLKRAGRRRGIETDAERIQQLFRQEAPRQLLLVEDAMGKQAQALLLQLDAACQAVDDLARATEEAFRSHPDAAIMLSFPGIGPQVGARILGEIGDDRSRFATAGGLKAYAGSAPVTRACFRQAPLCRSPVREEQPAQPRRPPVGLRLHQRFIRRGRPLPAPPGRRGLAHAGSAAPVQPHAGAAASLPPRPRSFRRSHRFPSRGCDAPAGQFIGLRA